jgi:hypothetical protein
VYSKYKVAQLTYITDQNFIAFIEIDIVSITFLSYLK